MTDKLKLVLVILAIPATLLGLLKAIQIPTKDDLAAVERRLTDKLHKNETELAEIKGRLRWRNYWNPAEEDSLPTGPVPQ